MMDSMLELNIVPFEAGLSVTLEGSIVDRARRRRRSGRCSTGRTGSARGAGISS